MYSRAENALRFFHDRMQAKFPASYPFSFAELLEYVQGLNPWFMKTFDGALKNATSLSDADIKNVISDVADVSKGKMFSEPRHLIVFYDALLQRYDLSNFSTWVRLGSETVAATVDDIKVAAAIGFSGLAIYGLIAVAIFAFTYGGKRV